MIVRGKEMKCGLLQKSLVVVLLAAAAWGQPQAQRQKGAEEVLTAPVGGDTDEPEHQWTREEIQQRRKQVNEEAALAEEARTKALEFYDKALAQLDLLEQYRAQTAGYTQKRESAPVELEKLRAELEKAAPEVEVDIPPDVPLDALEQMMSEAAAVHEDLAREAAVMENEPRRRLDRRTRIPEELGEAQEQLEQASEQLAEFAVDVSAPEVSQARQIFLQVQTQTLQAKIQMLEEEQRYYDATGELLEAQRDMAARQAEAAEKKLAIVREALEAARRAQAAQLETEAQEAARAARDAFPVVRQLAEENAQLAEAASRVVAEMEAAREYGRQLETDLTRLQQDFEEIKLLLEGSGEVTHVIGVLLLTRRTDLPDLRPHRERLRAREGKVSQAQLMWSTYDKRWEELRDSQGLARRLLAEAGLHEGESGHAEIYRETLRLLQEQRQIVNRIAGYYRDYSELLARNDQKELALIKAVEAYRQFIDERILWVRSSPAFGPEDFKQMGQSVRRLAVPSNWRGAALVLWGDMRRHAVLYGVFALVLAGLMYRRRRMIEDLGRLTRRVGTKYSDSFVHTWKTLGLTAALAAPLPATLLFAARRLDSAVTAGGFSEALAAGLWACGWVVAAYRLWVFFYYPGGLGQQLGFNPDVVRAMRRHAQWFFPLLIPVVFLEALFVSQGPDSAEANSIGRLLFVAEQVLLAVFLAIILEPRGPVLRRYLAANSEGAIYQFRYLWYGAATAIPMSLAGLALMGYFYAAEHLYGRLVASLLFVVAIIFVNAFFRRWLAVAQKRIEIRQKRQQLSRPEDEKLPRADIAERAAGKAVEELSEEAQEEQVDVSSRQAIRLVQAINVLVLAAGMWWLWRDVLPALEGFRDVTVWTTSDAQGNQIVVSVTALVRAAVIGALTVIVARNVPGLLDMVILQRLSFDAGSRFAVTTVVRYVIVVVGVVVTFGQLGIGWSKVQWLVAAVTVGLGFGLQEIFANFVSGLIILFERPIRVGDIVTIGGFSGRVTQIRIRATTIRQWDRKELVVPNKEFITGQLINWSLTDKMLQMSFRVGVAYGSDVARTEQVLYRVARGHPLVIADDPAPVVLFKEFGESTLNFELQVCVPNMDNYLKVWHEINCMIEAEFRKQGIEIAVPQRDVRIRSGVLAVRTDGRTE
ncbi:MAG TPA: mechanosensitive ion channel [Anaerohalosphaeraceae bacterium]|jgi:potassium efflux system protein|nr:mechanosensitive ion channel [Anaerohalosphaeraceae bacterium]HRT51488.1 mechanosensitive ion channel [Anaerohalosphaeraceae bacterium]HRT87177.1 mechanosensitive ion channel [Anaerohalosphaeraceae bacterium]